MGGNGPGLVFQLVFGSIGLVFVGVGLALVVRSWRELRRVRTWPRTQGEVVSVAQERRVSQDSDGDRTVRYVLVAHYRYQHPRTRQWVEAQGELGKHQASAGSSIELIYDPADPAHSRIPNATAGATVFLTVFGLVFAAAGVAAVVVAFFMGSWFGSF